MPAHDPGGFATIHLQYVTAREARDASERRYREANDALMAAQCGVHYATIDIPGRCRTRRYCTLPIGHQGDHGKYRAGDQ